ncbi:sugar transferase [Stieleria varia]|uniref:UDP-N-acetylgalactosamine-undecaprenyl-phosphate N-acetylgalactosaminephosphotransferase n=1 Tax=Stieleria varia TaxID=2528005 RepID=A0A5C6APV3_9BACT|nr:sugar transferase [Stieleria varia]TWU01259.1 UDP-N-acetylgalactosamine-undecaprenyl-phosphate N-acetylgalactosaminephosphotransferase [Stieleria varia]
MPTLDELLPEYRFATKRDETPLPTLPQTHRRYRYFARKDRVERAMGACLLVPALPVIAVCWVAIRLTSKGPGLFRQTRVGRGGRTFEVLKLRTMRQDAEAGGPQWSSKGDPRITRLGRILRSLHLDELPQLVNVVRGEMVIVGPRPERPEFVELLTEEIPGYQRRLIVKPGITGLSQINLPPDTDLRSVQRKQVLDLHHIDNAHLWFDARMVMLTTLRVLCISNETLTRLMGLDRKHLLAELPPTNDHRHSVSLQELLAQARLRKELAEIDIDDDIEDAAQVDGPGDSWKTDSDSYDDDATLARSPR